VTLQAKGGAIVATVPKESHEELTYSELRNGDHLRRSEFHQAYLQMPKHYRAELLAGVVYEPSPVSWTHGETSVELIALVAHYAKRTPGIKVATDVTVILSDEDEVQPDIVLRIDKKFGGQSEVKNKYVQGAPELVAEIAYSSQAIDLHLKKKRYALAGVVEYVVVCLKPERIYWFDLRSERELFTDAESIVRSAVLPGLWIHKDALLELDTERTMQTLNQGLQSSEYAEFVAKLKQRSGL
jgi:Uma2 family endonuclease